MVIELTDKKRQIVIKSFFKKALTSLGKYGLNSNLVECYFDLYFYINKEDKSKIYPVMIVDQVENPYNASFPSLYFHIVQEDLPDDLNLFSNKNENYIITKNQILPITTIKKSDLKFDNLVFSGEDENDLELDMTKEFKVGSSTFRLFDITKRFPSFKECFTEDGKMQGKFHKIVVDDEKTLGDIDNGLVDRNTYVLIDKNGIKVEIFRQFFPFKPSKIVLDFWIGEETKDGRRMSVMASQYISNIKLCIFYRYIDVWN